MVYVRSRKFCCCLPVRLGVLILSLGISLLGGLVAVVGWIDVKNLRDNPLPKGDEISLYIHAAMFSILCLVGAFGFIGAIGKQRGLVSIFGTMLALHLVFSVATGIYTLYTLFKRNTDDALANCIINSTDPNPSESCHRGLKILKIVAVVAYCVSWLVELYACLVITSYVKQLREEEEANIVHPSASMSHYYAPPAPQPNAYPFSQPGQAQGNQAAYQA